MQINSETWTKDAFELIDYENEYLIPYSFETRESGFLVRIIVCQWFVFASI